MGHGHGHAHHRAGERRRLRLVLAITATVMAVEIAGAWVTGSLALLADAGHLATDAAAIVLALGASLVAALPGGKRSTFGYHRAEVLAAVINALVLLVVCGYLAYAGIGRLADPRPVDAGPMVGFAVVGLLANALALTILNRAEDASINLRGAVNEVAADLLGSVLAVLAGVVIATTGWYRADAVASLVIAVLILPRSLVLLRDAGAVLLEIAPAGLDLDQVRAQLLAVPGVLAVHDLHAWAITSGLASLSAHVQVDEVALSDRGLGVILDDLALVMAERFGVRHTTFQVEPESHLGHEDLGPAH